MRSVLQISDPHFGTERPTVVEALLRFAHLASPDCIVLSGDLTQRARGAQFEATRDFIRALPGATHLVLPGNHDIPLFNLWRRFTRPYAAWQAALGPMQDVVPLALPGIRLIGLNTARIARHTDGEVSRGQQAAVADFFASAPASHLKLVVVHHPPRNPPGVDHHRPLRGGEQALLDWAAAGADMVLSGHIHFPACAALTVNLASGAVPLWSVVAGTATSRRTLAGIPNSVNLLRYTPAERHRVCVVERWDFDAATQSFIQRAQQQAVLRASP